MKARIHSTGVKMFHSKLQMWTSVESDSFDQTLTIKTRTHPSLQRYNRVVTIRILQSSVTKCFSDSAIDLCCSSKTGTAWLYARHLHLICQTGGVLPWTCMERAQFVVTADSSRRKKQKKTENKSSVYLRARASEWGWTVTNIISIFNRILKINSTFYTFTHEGWFTHCEEETNQLFKVFWGSGGGLSSLRQ